MNFRKLRGPAAASIVLGLAACGAAEDSEVLEQSQEHLRKGLPGAMNGDGSYCNDPNNKCIAGEGDCDSTAQCVAGQDLICATNQGAKWGLSPGVDVCQGSTCTNGVKDGTELGVDCGSTCPSCAPSGSNSANFGGAGDQHGRGMGARKSDGSYAVVGLFEGTANVGGMALNSVAGQDVFVAQYNANGSHAWSLSFGGPNNDGDNGVGIAVDQVTGNVAVCGNMGGTVNFGGGDRTAAGGYDAFIAVYSPTGAHVWSQAFGGPGLDRFVNVAYDNQGNLVATGSFNQSGANFGGAALNTNGVADIVVAKYNGATGAHIWSKGYGGPGGDNAQGLTTDLDRYVVVTGSYSQTMTMGTALTTNGGTDIFLARLNPSSGNVVWSKSFGGSGGDIGFAVGTDNNRRPVMVGHFRRTADFGAGPVTAPGTDRTDIVTIAFTQAGAYRWSKTLGGDQHDQGLAIAVDGDGNATVGGVVRGTVSGLNPDGTTYTSAGLADAFLIKYRTTDGEPLSGTAYGSTGDDTVQAISLITSKLLVMGNFTGTATFGTPTALTSNGVDFWVSHLSY
jgi:hypothetical protein